VSNLAGTLGLRRRRSSLKRSLLRSVMTLVLGYVAANVTAIAFVPLLWTIQLEVNVRDAQSGAPLSGAHVQLVRPHSHPQDLGVTDEAGSARCTLVHQQQPGWAWPPIGTLAIRGDLEVHAPDGRSTTRSLQQAVGSQRIGRGRIVVSVSMPER
jgi:hypothetical protein